MCEKEAHYLGVSDAPGTLSLMYCVGGQSMPLFLRLAVVKPALGLRMIVRPLMIGPSFGRTRTQASGSAQAADPASRQKNIRNIAQHFAQLDRLEL